MTRQEHDDVFIKFSLAKMNHRPSKELLLNEWIMAIIEGTDQESAEEMEKGLLKDWEHGGEILYHQLKAGLN